MRWLYMVRPMSIRHLLPALLLATLAHAEDPATFPVGALTFTRPADWKWVAVTSPMRKAQLQVPGAAADQAADVTFFFFGETNGGGVDANVQRWLKQFDAKEGAGKTSEEQLAGLKVHLVSTEGTFSSGMPGGPTTPQANYALLGAIIEHPEGFVFVKMTGPAATVTAAREKFLELLKTVTVAKK